MSHTVMLGVGGVGLEGLTVEGGGVTPPTAPDSSGLGVNVAHSGTASAASGLRIR